MTSLRMSVWEATFTVSEKGFEQFIIANAIVKGAVHP